MISELDRKLSGPAKMLHALSSTTSQKDAGHALERDCQDPEFARPRGRFGSDSADEEWSLAEPFLPRPEKRGRSRTTDLREVSDAVQFMLAAGCRRRSIPPCFPPSATVQHHFQSWRRDGVFARILDGFRAIGRELAGRFERPAAAAVDSQSVKTTESGGPSGCDAGKKVKGRKRHIAVDVEGLLIEIAIQPASTQDRDGAPAAVLGMLEKAPDVAKLRADGGCQGPKLAAELEKLGLGSALEIVKKSNNVKEFTVLYRRWVVERAFAWISRCRRLAKDYEGSLESSLAWSQLAACRFMARRVARAATCCK